MRRSKYLIGGGLLLLGAALLLALGNLWEAHRVGEEAQRARQAVVAAAATAAILPPDSGDTTPEPTPTPTPAYRLDPEMEMPTVEVEGEAYLGVLDIPALDLSLPVLSQLSDAGLRLAPCRYKGSAYLGDMILAGHNYRQHFGSLHRLSPGDAVTFTDVDGNQFNYQVSQVERLPGTAIQEMEAGEWDLTLFTCTLSREARITIRCQAVEEQ